MLYGLLMGIEMGTWLNRVRKVIEKYKVIWIKHEYFEVKHLVAQDY